MKLKLEDIKKEFASHGGAVQRLIQPGENKGKIATMNFALLEKDMKVQPHVHEDGEEFFFFLEGKGETEVGEEKFSVEKGDFITVPQGQMHVVRNKNDEPLSFISVRTIKDS